jgi:uncharacterized protein YbjT (DUF2867 family)
MKIVIAGGTGLVGGQVIDRLARLIDVEVHLLLRKALEKQQPSIVQHVLAPEQWPLAVQQMLPDVAISCLGTTIRTAGSQDAFRAVDHDLILSFAGAAKKASARHMIVVSSVGARAKSSNFYLKTKGETEDALRALGFERLDILRPGLLTGGQRPDSRPGEAIGILLSPLTDLLMLGPLARYRSTPSAKVAQAIATLALGCGRGQHIHENDAICALAG